MQLKLLSYFRISGFLFIFFMILSLAGTSFAINTYQDSKGRFIIDLPDGWKLEPQQDESTFVFKEGSSSIILQYLSNMNNPEELFKQAVSTLKDSGLSNATQNEETKDLVINNNKARIGLYADEMQVGSMKVKLYGLVGGVGLDNGGVYFLSILNNTTLTSLRETLEKSFQSIRSTGQAATGVSETTIAKVDAASGESTPFKNDYLSLTLPAGWMPQDIPSNFEKEVIAWFKSNTITGASVMVSCYQGWRFNYSNVRRGGLNTIAAVYPKGQKMLEDKTTVTTDSGREAIFELWQGINDSDGQTMVMQSPMGVLQNQNCWLLLIGYVSDSGGPRLEEDFIKILKSIQ